MGTAERLAPTAVEGDEVVVRLADPAHAHLAVRLWSDVDLGADLDLAAVPGGWELRLPMPDLDGLEYLLDVDGALTPDPDGAQSVDGAFGPHSWLPLPGYMPPGWLDVEPVDGVRTPLVVEGTPVGTVETQVWQPAGAQQERLPLLLVHDGPQMERFGRVTRYAAAMVGSGALRPFRVALLAPGPRDERYAANPAYAAALNECVVPELLAAHPGTDRPVLLGQSLGALAALHAAWTAPDLFAGLMLQSGSFFTPELDPQEAGYSHFVAVTGFVASVLETPSVARFPDVAMTCGSAEENLADNRLMRDHLRAVGLPVSWQQARQGHTWTCWRDTLHPTLADLLHRVWGA
jgi:enterochelin esterase family protein